MTYPLSVNLQGLAGVKTVRASSMFGFSLITVAFEDAVDNYFARQRVLGTLRLEHSTAEHALAMAAEKLANLGLAAQALGVELQELEGRARTAGALRSQLSKERTAAEAALAKVPADPPPVVMARGDARAASQTAEEARREAGEVGSDDDVEQGSDGRVEHGYPSLR